jgi:hypothetical protein
MVSIPDKDKNHDNLKRHGSGWTLFELQEFDCTIVTEEPTPELTPEQQQAIDTVNKLADEGKIKSKVELT